MAEWRAAHPDRVREIKRRHVEKSRQSPKTPEQIAADRAYKREAAARWRALHPDRAAAAKLRYRQRVAAGLIPEDRVSKTKERQRIRAQRHAERQKALPPDALEVVKARHRERSRRHREKDTARSNAIARASYERRKPIPKTPEMLEKKRAKGAEWRARMRSTPKGRAYLNRLTASWRARNKEKVATWDAINKARRAGASDAHTHAEWLDCLARYGHRCIYCGIHLTSTTRTRDHVTPIVRGGTNDISNIVPACRSCNCRKNSMTLHEYLEYLFKQAAQTGSTS